MRKIITEEQVDKFIKENNMEIGVVQEYGDDVSVLFCIIEKLNDRIKELENLLIKVLVYRQSRLKDNLVAEIGRVLRNEENK